MKVPKNTLATIILKWKKFGTTKTLPRAGRRAKLSNRGRRALVSEVTKNPMVTLTELQSRLGVSQTAPKGLSMRNKILWSDETKVKKNGGGISLPVSHDIKCVVTAAQITYKLGRGEG